VLWVVLAVAMAGNEALDALPSFAWGPDYASTMIEELRPLDRRLPRRAALSYVGPHEIGGSSPAWVARNALAPRLVIDPPGADHLSWLAERGVEVPPPPRLLLIWGDVDSDWYAAHPDIRVLYRASENARVGWRR